LIRAISKNRDETIALGARIARHLKKGDVVALIGELGSGKTVFVKGIAKGLGVGDVRYVNSPSFVIVKEYKGKIPLYHFDIYRLDKPASLETIGYDEYFYGDGVTAIEWADKIKNLLPKRRIEVEITIRADETRAIKIKGI
jgi:tRNA threonylcarbamoyladenosine biosynthesis protein TsaE